MFSGLYCPSRGPQAPSVWSKKHLKKTSLEKCTFSPLLRASSKVLIITRSFSVPEVEPKVRYWCTVWHCEGVFISTDIRKDGLSQEGPLRTVWLLSFLISSLTYRLILEKLEVNLDSNGSFNGWIQCWSGWAGCFIHSFIKKNAICHFQQECRTLERNCSSYKNNKVELADSHFMHKRQSATSCYCILWKTTDLIIFRTLGRLMKVWNNGFNVIAYLIVMIILFPAADAYIYLFMGHAAPAAGNDGLERRELRDNGK